jgi:hypothetical protein
MQYGTAKNETVPISNRKPIKKVFPNLKKDVSVSLKFQIKKVSLIKNDIRI